ncbi:hypothetical protein AB6C73_18630, partial [Vibrio splendidus]
MASNFCKNVVKMQVVGALSGYLLTKSPFVNASIATSTTKTKKGTLLGNAVHLRVNGIFVLSIPL